MFKWSNLNLQKYKPIPLKFSADSDQLKKIFVLIIPFKMKGLSLFKVMKKYKEILKRKKNICLQKYLIEIQVKNNYFKSVFYRF